ncbi:hypothetical protein [Frigoriflavimonas asaccharolytica]|uniref:ParE-like toxin of type II ParDE toxin-antitoxin system n=1 Tax=Frigoriflavimonas asaccharolytica TaxID=2735899 RepID=A0A8J8GBM2_9FLAO|nr:hypothetical protein [Frigoriflavimonas asaccharolytica]NRS92980.1 hypothetical protein [Frigoriflavimonas asaccharolytica]
MEILLSSIAKNDLRLLIRIFKAEDKENAKIFLKVIKKSIQKIVDLNKNLDIKGAEIQIYKTDIFPVSIHYIIEKKNTLFVTAIFKD